jgi:hypothetical protein
MENCMVNLEKIKRIELIPQKGKHYLEEFTNDGHVVACDFAIEGIEKGIKIPGGYRMGNVDNVDHHAPGRRMSRRISSTPLAIRYLKNALYSQYRVKISHTDADSICSAGILARVLQPLRIFSVAAITADHGGVENPIAILLQALESERDIGLSFRNLKLLLDGRRLETRAQEHVSRHVSLRKKAQTLIKSHFTTYGRVTYGYLPEKYESDWFPELLPNAQIIFYMYPSKEEPNKNHLKIRLGIKAPKGIYLNELTLPNFGGRWNAGSSERIGPIDSSPVDYALTLNDVIENVLTKRP